MQEWPIGHKKHHGLTCLQEEDEVQQQWLLMSLLPPLQSEPLILPVLLV
jgi:hypothetical protein